MRPRQKTGRSAQYLLSSSARTYGTRSRGRHSGGLATPQQGSQYNGAGEERRRERDTVKEREDGGGKDGERVAA